MEVDTSDQHFLRYADEVGGDDEEDWGGAAVEGWGCLTEAGIRRDTHLHLAYRRLFRNAPCDL